ncbi:unnamed protein product [Dracunculus medinensis]|uniref:Secreted protein n=1 Tax=Dracunculus medinensis TaxID=318479 RepID=A0A0N4UR76_DRAME|nr:unnamed protein product [Dracunculus medinensis]
MLMRPEKSMPIRTLISLLQVYIVCLRKPLKLRYDSLTLFNIISDLILSAMMDGRQTMKCRCCLQNSLASYGSICVEAVTLFEIRLLNLLNFTNMSVKCRELAM